MVEYVKNIIENSVGEFAKVSAYPAEGEKFLGWYRNGKLISKDKEYRFCVKGNTTLVAKFTDKRVKVGNKAFYNCKRLKNITIKSKKLKSVGKYAFKGIAKYATIKCPGKKMKKYKKMIKESKVKNTVRFK